MAIGRYAKSAAAAFFTIAAAAQPVQPGLPAPPEQSFWLGTNFIPFILGLLGFCVLVAYVVVRLVKGRRNTAD